MADSGMNSAAAVALAEAELKAEEDKELSAIAKQFNDEFENNNNELMNTIKVINESFHYE
jgi:hypothetical protein